MKYKIDELAEIVDGDRGKNYPKQEDFCDNGFCLFLDAGNVTPNGFSFESNHFITEEKSNSLRKGTMQRGDIAYTTRGTVGNVAYYSDSVPFENIRINSGMVIIRVKDDTVSASFLYQLLKHESYRKYFKKYCTGSAQPQLPIKIFSKIEINIPDRKIQDKIADILSAYDSLIDNNQKQIRLLEEAAQRIYKEWFVDLRFPGWETTPVVDGVPEGWRINRADAFFQITIGKTPPRAEKQWFTSGNRGIPWLSISDMGNAGVYAFEASEGLTEDAVKKHKMKLVPAGTILVSFKLTVGRVTITDMEMCTNEAIAHFYIGNNVQRAYTYCYLRNFEYDTLGNTSSISKAVNSQIIKAMPFIMPDEKTIADFSEMIAPLLDEIKNKQKTCLKLQEARNRLLPKLMSGEIEV